jgi:glucokinase
VGKDNAKDAYIGIDIGGTKSQFALFDDRFEVLAEDKFRTHPEKGGAKAFTRAMKAVVLALIAEARKRGREVRVVGVGCAGDIDMKAGVVRSSPNLAFLSGYPFRERLEKLTGARVFIGHDVQTGLYGEYRLGAARKSRHAIGVWLGTGVGGALIINGRLHVGASCNAGDIGNFLLHVGETSEARKEVLDSVASRTAIAGDAAALAAKHRAPALRKVAGTDVTDIKSSDLAEAIRKGDKAVEKLVRSRASVLGAALATLVDFLNPDTIVLGGGLAEALPAILRNEVRKAIQSHAAPKSAKAVKVVVSRLGDHAGTTGAARLALDMFGAKPPIEL